ncbi:uncharacterized protein TNCV_3964391 [Trichonephila clavipes]|nr:uncharacterized protein TNCV_3964391 [Trichonephila clavipes]
MQKAASELLVLHPTKNKIVECGISVKGTWQRRGYSSMNGCVAALSVDTGKVVDIEIMSSYCPTCRKISKMPRSIESETFAADHVCHSNFQGSALKMEAVGATRIFQRSIVKRGLKYAHYYCDGDSKGFISVKDTYGKDSVTKYECIGHVQKRVGARLRKLKSKNKNLSGKGKHTDSFIDQLQNYYGIAVRSNVGNLSGLQQNVIAALFHCSSSVEKPMHGQCPIGKDSWCYYQRALPCGKKPNEKYKGLLNEVLNTIKPTYLELCTKELLTKCLHGKTQNSNECLNGVIWQRVPKEVFVCLKILKSGALDAVIQFNDGYKGCVEIFKKLNITPGYFTLKAYKHLDINRINDAERHSTPNVKQRRKSLRATREKNQCFRECTDKLSDNDIIDLTLDLTVNGVVGLEGDNDEEEKSTPLTGKLIQEDLQLCSKLENHFLINAPNSERAFKLQQRATQNKNAVCENPWPLPQISIAETVSSDDEGDLEPLHKRCKPLSDSEND